MTAVLRILSPGMSTTIQDLGRPGFQRYGVGVSGALDLTSLHAANCLVGNSPDVGALEALYVGPGFVVEADSARLAFVGADARIEILPFVDAPSGRLTPPGRSVQLQRGQVVRVGSLRNSAVLYIAVEGGFAIEPTLGSVSTDSRCKIGGWHGRPLISDDLLPLRRSTASERDECSIEGLDHTLPRIVRVICGPQTDYFSETEIERFFASEYTVGANSNRMGMKLEGEPLRHCRGFNIVSDALTTGSVQVPGNGQPIVLLADHQTTGGYPKIATVISADLPGLGRLPIGTKLSFVPTTLAEAVLARSEFAASIEAICKQMVRISSVPALDEAQLLECNLISGVHDAAA